MEKVVLIFSCFLEKKSVKMIRIILGLSYTDPILSHRGFARKRKKCSAKTITKQSIWRKKKAVLLQGIKLEVLFDNWLVKVETKRGNKIIDDDRFNRTHGVILVLSLLVKSTNTLPWRESRLKSGQSKRNYLDDCRQVTAFLGAYWNKSSPYKDTLKTWLVVQSAKGI